MTQYETLMKLREMYHDKDETLNKTRELLTELRADAKTDEDYDFSWIEASQTETRIQRDCIEYVARQLFPELEIDFWKERY